ncbi:hypothetical protein PO878_04125 [Iamia majanohamensis]|uniref:Uncharacterized protein n=1 Tax=Iamia majanohamensis TaxID=467976 RepID=A0AAE9Y6N6_9ACTN|nr:hypothetical protein [Iamia majanohamensis]WCO67910.1 hypothetical protein PO878_04125 [Iamia majanohamensis]
MSTMGHDAEVEDRHWTRTGWDDDARLYFEEDVEPADDRCMSSPPQWLRRQGVFGRCGNTAAPGSSYCGRTDCLGNRERPA